MFSTTTSLTPPRDFLDRSTMILPASAARLARLAGSAARPVGGGPAEAGRIGLLWPGFLAACMLVIAGISAADAYLNLKYPVTALNEENPMARWILAATGDDRALLISLKLLGTAAVIGILCVYFALRRKQALVVAGVLALGQCYVICYILLA